jgi:hypothetical protein
MGCQDIDSNAHESQTEKEILQFIDGQEHYNGSKLPIFFQRARTVLL